ncbi:MAG: glycosyltransferase family 9 protein [Bacteroidales bacterium]
MKVLLVRFSSIGDIVLTTPVIRCMKKQAGVELHMLTFGRFSAVLEHNPYIDRLITVDHSISEVLPQLRQNRYDLIVDLHRNIRTLSLKLKLRRPSVSFRKLNFRKYLLVNLKLNLMPENHIVDRYMATVRRFGVINDGQGLDYFLNPGQGGPEQLLPAGFHPGYIAFVIGGRYLTKIYPAPMVAEAADQLPLPVVLMGGPEDRERGELICRAMQHNIVLNGCGSYSLGESAAVVAGASLVIANDTGLMHIAAAFGRKILSIWGNTVPALGMGPYLPDHLLHYSTILEMEGVTCRPCSKLGYAKCPRKHFNCMLMISPENVVNAANDLLALPPL